MALSSSSPPSSRGKSSPFETYQVLSDKACSWLDGKHVVFGEVLEGYEIVEKIEQAETQPGDKPTKTVKIAKSGELPVPEEGIHVEL